jgi:hypothetical protein
VQENVKGETYDVITVLAYAPETFGVLARQANETLDDLGKQLKLPALRERRREQPLDPYRKNSQQVR